MNKDNTYFIVHRWMSTRLKLSGCSRDIYAIIYGFSQDGESNFHGSIRYLSDLSGYSERKICEVLKELTNKNLLIKELKTGRIVPSYRVNLNIEEISDYEEYSSNNSEETSVKVEDTSDDNILNNINNKDISNHLENNYLKNKKKSEIISEATKQVVDYLNKVCHTNFRVTKPTKDLVSKRLTDGFTVENIKEVIDFKQRDWGDKPIQFSDGKMSNTFLRPDTLLGRKFESYLHEARGTQKKQEQTNTATHTGKILRSF